MSRLKVYVDLISQPCRALVLFLNSNNIQYEQCFVDLRKGMQKTEEFRRINSFQKVPVIEHDGFKLTESIAILQYLAAVYKVPDHWYPEDARKRARVDEFLNWQHENLRYYGSRVFWTRVLQMPLDQEKLAENTKDFDKCLGEFEEVFLPKAAMINGAKDISIADLLAAVELEKPLAAGYDLSRKFPRVEDYLERVKNRIGPEYDEVHETVYRVRDRVKQENS